MAYVLVTKPLNSNVKFSKSSCPFCCEATYSCVLITFDAAIVYVIRPRCTE
jgi:hypothetical protein